MAVIDRVVKRVIQRNAGGIQHGGVHERAGQAAKDETLIVQALNLRPIQVLVVPDLRQRGVHRVGKIKHTKTAVTEA
ncbi:hypothetical protein D3C87_2035940 [compost metagenome]